MKNKTEICVPIRDEKELQQAKEILLRNGEKIDEKIFYLSKSTNLNYLLCDDLDWFLTRKGDETEIPLSELESVLKGESVEKQSFISKACNGEICSVCGESATNKLEETIFFDEPNKMRHPLTAYVCREHFQMIVGTFKYD